MDCTARPTCGHIFQSLKPTAVGLFVTVLERDQRDLRALSSRHAITLKNVTGGGIGSKFNNVIKGN